jgi:hypothetical protein
MKFGMLLELFTDLIDSVVTYRNVQKPDQKPVHCLKTKAFHVNYARDGHALGIMFKVIREVVILMSPSSSFNAP